MSASNPDAIAPLLARLRAGDPAVLSELFAVYRAQLRSMVDLRLDPRLVGRVSGSDVLQDTYLDALKRLPHYFEKPDMPFYLWLRMVAAQCLVDVHRRHFGAEMRSISREVALDGYVAPSASSASLAARLVSDVESPSQIAMRNETLAALEQALSSMDDVDREILALRHFEELTNDEVASVLGLKKAAASNRYVRALQRLRELLEKVSSATRRSPPEGR